MSVLQPEIADRYELARAIGLAAGQLTLKYFRHEIQINRKEDDSPVTVADREAETYLREQITASFPHDGIVGEEFPDRSGTSGYRWILDPIDGTKSFISGVPLYGTMVAVQHQMRSVIGVIAVPGLGECVHAAAGHGAWYEAGGKEAIRTHVSPCPRLAEGLLVTSQIDSFPERDAWDVYQKLEQSAWITRTWGDCYGYLLVATGRAVVMIDPVMEIWDAAAAQPIMEEAGGTFTDWQGRATVSAGEGIGTNGLVLDEVLQVTKAHVKRG